MEIYLGITYVCLLFLCANTPPKVCLGITYVNLLFSSSHDFNKILSRYHLCVPYLFRVRTHTQNSVSVSLMPQTSFLPQKFVLVSLMLPSFSPPNFVSASLTPRPLFSPLKTHLSTACRGTRALRRTLLFFGELFSSDLDWFGKEGRKEVRMRTIYMRSVRNSRTASCAESVT